MAEGQDNAAATEDAGAEDKTESQTAQYATKEDLGAVTKALESLQEQLAGQVTEEADPTDEASIQRLYSDMVGEGQAVKEEAAVIDPVEQRLDRMEKLMLRKAQIDEARDNAAMRDKINAQGRAKYDDWEANENAIWKFAAQPEHRAIKSLDKVYVLWKLQEQGPEGLTPKEKKVATDAAKESEDAKAAGSEKPGTESSGKQREHSDRLSLLQETYDNMPAKPQFF